MGILGISALCLALCLAFGLWLCESLEDSSSSAGHWDSLWRWLCAVSSSSEAHSEAQTIECLG